MTNTKYRGRAKAAAAAAFIGLAVATLTAGCGDSDRAETTGTASNSASVEGGESMGAMKQDTPTAEGHAPHSPESHADDGHGHDGHGHDSGDAAAASHSMGNSGMDALKTLEGKAFDIAFLSQMIAHHKAAVMMAKQALDTASKPETKQEAQKVIDAQSKEIAQMTGWLKQWYAVTPSQEQQALVNADMKGMMEMPVTSDQMFFAMMIPHHQGAIDMSALVPTRSKRPEVKKLAEQIIRDQKAEIAVYQRRLGQGG